MVTEWLKEMVLLRLSELSDREYQERVWVRGDPNEMSSFTEAICGLFDDTGINDLWDKKRVVFDVEIDNLLRELHRETRPFDYITSDEEKIRHPKWPRVRELASRAKQLVERVSTDSARK